MLMDLRLKLLRNSYLVWSPPLPLPLPPKKQRNPWKVLKQIKACRTFVKTRRVQAEDRQHVCFSLF